MWFGKTWQVEVAAVQDEEADETATVQDVKADEVPKAPADLIARMPASIRQKQKAEAESRSNSKMGGMIARVLASSRNSKKEQAANESGWSGGRGRMLGYILEEMTLSFCYIVLRLPLGGLRLAWPACPMGTTMRRLCCD